MKGNIKNTHKITMSAGTTVRVRERCLTPSWKFISYIIAGKYNLLTR
jgi:hypothetical protein